MPKDVTVNRQVLAEPDAALATKTWASLEDGTPLVTGERRGKGLVSLFHVSADMRWSDLPMSGTFVEMLRRIVDMSGYTSNRRAPASPGEGSARNGGAAAHARRLRRVRAAALDRQAAAGRLSATAPRRSSAGILWPGRRSARGEYAGRRRSHRAARYLAACAARRASLHQLPNRATCAAILLSSALALFLIDAIVVALLGGGIRGVAAAASRGTGGAGDSL